MLRGRLSDGADGMRCCKAEATDLLTHSSRSGCSEPQCYRRLHTGWLLVREALRISVLGRLITCF